MSFSFQFELGQSEQLRACRIMYNRRWSTRGTYAFFFASGAIFILLWLTDRLDVDDGTHFVFVGLCAAVGALTALYLSPVWTVRGFRKKNRSASGPYVYALTETGIDAQAPGTSSSIVWTNVAEVYETREFLFFYVSAAWAMVLPKRVISDADLAALKMALRLWTGEKARLRP